MVEMELAATGRRGSGARNFGSKKEQHPCGCCSFLARSTEKDITGFFENSLVIRLFRFFCKSLLSHLHGV